MRSLPFCNSPSSLGDISCIKLCRLEYNAARFFSKFTSNKIIHDDLLIPWIFVVDYSINLELVAASSIFADSTV